MGIIMLSFVDFLNDFAFKTTGTWLKDADEHLSKAEGSYYWVHIIIFFLFFG